VDSSLHEDSEGSGEGSEDEDEDDEEGTTLAHEEALTGEGEEAGEGRKPMIQMVGAGRTLDSSGARYGRSITLGPPRMSDTHLFCTPSHVSSLADTNKATAVLLWQRLALGLLDDGVARALGAGESFDDGLGAPYVDDEAEAEAGGDDGSGQGRREAEVSGGRRVKVFCVELTVP
jgi:hypothetical protein